MTVTVTWLDAAKKYHCEPQEWPCVPRLKEAVIIDGSRYLVADVTYQRTRTSYGSDVRVTPPTTMVVTPYISLERVS